jgi:hypothetical protein
LAKPFEVADLISQVRGLSQRAGKPAVKTPDLKTPDDKTTEKNEEIASAAGAGA